MAAGQAAQRGLKVILLEKKNEPAKKLRITGNGRCNLTNTLPLDEFIPHFGRSGKFLKTAFSEFFSKELIRFFESIGVKTSVDHRGRIYPRSNSADDVAEALIKWVSKCGVKIINQAAAKGILVERRKIIGVQIQGWKKDLDANAIVIATGGASYPGTGSSGDGYRLAELLGHNIMPIRPASVPLITEVGLAGRLKGTSLKGITVSVKVDGKFAVKDSGDLLFTHFGVSGPAVLNISGRCVEEMKSGKSVSISIDMLPNLKENQAERVLLQQFDQHGKAQIQTILKRWMPAKMASEFLREIGIEPSTPCSQIKSKQRGKIRGALRGFEIKIVGHRPLAEAQVTAGGVSLKEVDPQTMESRLIKGLYFAGEVLDLDADTGGFNLQSAFSTGWLAGRKCHA